MLNYLEKHILQTIKKFTDDEEISIYWKIIFEGKLSEKIKDMALESFNKLTTNSDKKAEFILIIGTLFEDGKNIKKCIQVLLKLDFTQFLLRSGGYYSDPKKLEEYVNNHKIISATLADCVTVHSKMKEKIKLNPKINPMEEVLDEESGISFGKHSKLYLDFLQAIFASTDNIPATFFDPLWTNYYFEQISNEHSNLFWNVLQKEGKNRYDPIIGFCKTKSDTISCFKKYFVDPKMFLIQSITVPAFNCFCKYFEIVNDLKGKITKKLLNEAIGIDTIWTIITESKLKEVRDQSASYLVSLYYKGIVSEKNGRAAIVEHFIAKVLSISCHEPIKCKPSLDLLKTFIQK